MEAGAKLDTRARILAVVDSIPPGSVATYGHVAAEAGWARRARQVGRCLRELPPGTAIPWHRVVAASGRIALARGSEGARLQRARLTAEGVPVSPAGRVDLERFRWRP
ncbi:MAG: MGMT family protein [Planctomycetota bacterium]